MARQTDLDVIIAGGGMVGLTLGCALAEAGLGVAIVDAAKPARWQDAAFDGRTSAIAHGSRRVLAGVGLWDAMDAQACPILDIRVTDQNSPLFLHYDHTEVGGDPLGHIVENRAIRAALMQRAEKLANLTLRAPARIAEVTRDAHRVRVGMDDGSVQVAALLCGCDGRVSAQRRAAGIAATEWRYGQTGIVCTVMHERPHHNVAHERFLPAGPFAILPMVDDHDGRHRSSIVWTERASLAPVMLALDDSAFLVELGLRFGDFLGPLSVAGPRWSYPLGLLHAERYTSERLALVGDAAHAIHPIAGQGLNMGLRDVAVLAEAVVDARRLGLDIGGAPVLQRYAQWRWLDNTTLMFVTDGLNRLFSNDLAPVRWARDLGLAGVNKMPSLRRLFMRHAMGLAGSLPRLARGLPL